MTQWVRLMLANGVIDGRRLVSEKGFEELTRKQINIAGTVDYGLGWFLRQWNGHKVVEHGGNIDGFNAQVALMPDQKLGFVLLTNVTASSLGGVAMNTIWKNLVGDPNNRNKGHRTCRRSKKRSWQISTCCSKFELRCQLERRQACVDCSRSTTISNAKFRRSSLQTSRASAAGFLRNLPTNQRKPAETELYLEQPQGNDRAAESSSGWRRGNSSVVADVPANTPLRDLIGSYEGDSKQTIEIAFKEGKVSLVIPGQQPYPLNENEKNKLRSPSLPEEYWVDVNRDDKGVVSGIVVNQPEGRYSFRRLASAAPLISVEELLTKMIDAYGGEANLRKHKSSLTTVDIDLENQGVQGRARLARKRLTSPAVR